MTPCSRRRFLRSSVHTLFAAPFVTSGLRAASPNEKLRHASFGASGMAWSDMTSLARHPSWELAAVCDVDSRHFEKVKNQWPDVRIYRDWRELLATEGDKIDSVNVSTPDHMHAAMGMAVMGTGKHLYGQKPLAQTLWECRQMMLMARQSQVMTQMGIQGSSGFSERLAVAMIQNGSIGKVTEVHTFSEKKWGDTELRPQRSDAIPPELDWDLWLGVAAPHDYIAEYDHPSQWRKRRSFGTGTLGDMGCHMFSGWFRALALAAPVAVKSTGPKPNADNWAIDGRVEYTFAGTPYTEADTLKVVWYDGDAKPPEAVTKIVTQENMKFPGQGTIYLGTEGALLAAHMTSPQLFPRQKFQGVKFPKLEGRDHWKEFVDCCLKGGNRPSANFDYSAPLTEAVLLGCLASDFPGETLQWDAAQGVIPNSVDAQKLVRREYRPGWAFEPVG